MLHPSYFFCIVMQPPVVRYGTTKHLSMKENTYLVHTYTADSMCQDDAKGKGFWHPGYTYDFLLKNLIPNTMYYYSYGTEDVSHSFFKFPAIFYLTDFLKTASVKMKHCTREFFALSNLWKINLYQKTKNKNIYWWRNKYLKINVHDIIQEMQGTIFGSFPLRI